MGVSDSILMIIFSIYRFTVLDKSKVASGSSSQNAPPKAAWGGWGGGKSSAQDKTVIGSNRGWEQAKNPLIRPTAPASLTGSRSSLTGAAASLTGAKSSSAKPSPKPSSSIDYFDFTE